jgi:hypothetical protein
VLLVLAARGKEQLLSVVEQVNAARGMMRLLLELMLVLIVHKGQVRSLLVHMLVSVINAVNQLLLVRMLVNAAKDITQSLLVLVPVIAARACGRSQ